MGKTHLTCHQDDSSGRTQLPMIFFDGECPPCRREIAHYRRLQGAELIEWVDIT